MNVYIANFGRENYEWPVCRESNTIATMNEVEDQKYWLAKDKEGYISNRMKKRTWSGIFPTRSVAARWFNLMSVVESSCDDIWIHRDKNEVWWTRTKKEPAYFNEKKEPVGDGRKVVVCYKPCFDWKNKDEKGRTLEWNALHPKAKDFLATEATLQKLSDDNSEFARTLLSGESLDSWYERRDWKEKLNSTKTPRSIVVKFSSVEISAFRMMRTAMQISLSSNGQEITSVKKNKDFNFANEEECRVYIKSLIEIQEGMCALSGIKLQFDDDCNDEDLLCSLDRIDSNGHYERGNLQVVCRFLNRWKGDSDDLAFRRLLNLLIEDSQLPWSIDSTSPRN